MRPLSAVTALRGAAVPAKQNTQGDMMEFTEIDSARSMRDGGIDAIAALHSALLMALAGLSADQSTALKRTVGNLMGEVTDHLVNPAIRAFPDLAISDDAEWSAIVRERARARATVDQ